MSILSRILTPAQRFRIEQEFKRRFILAHRKLGKVRSLLRAAANHDPWATLALLGVKNFTFIPHEPDRSKPVRVPLAADSVQDGPHSGHTVVAMTDAFVVGPQLKKYKRPQPDPNVEPLGPEDWELGLRVDPASPTDPEVVALRERWMSAPNVRHHFVGSHPAPHAGVHPVLEAEAAMITAAFAAVKPPVVSAVFETPPLEKPTDDSEK